MEKEIKTVNSFKLNGIYEPETVKKFADFMEIDFDQFNPDTLSNASAFQVVDMGRYDTVDGEGRRIKSNGRGSKIKIIPIDGVDAPSSEGDRSFGQVFKTKEQAALRDLKTIIRKDILNMVQGNILSRDKNGNRPLYIVPTDVPYHNKGVSVEVGADGRPAIKDAAAANTSTKWGETVSTFRFRGHKEGQVFDVNQLMLDDVKELPLYKEILSQSIINHGWSIDPTELENPLLDKQRIVSWKEIDPPSIGPTVGPSWISAPRARPLYENNIGAVVENLTEEEYKEIVPYFASSSREMKNMTDAEKVRAIYDTNPTVGWQIMKDINERAGLSGAQAKDVLSGAALTDLARLSPEDILEELGEDHSFYSAGNQRPNVNELPAEDALSAIYSNIEKLHGKDVDVQGAPEDLIFSVNGVNYVSEAAELKRTQPMYDMYHDLSLTFDEPFQEYRSYLTREPGRKDFNEGYDLEYYLRHNRQLDKEDKAYERFVTSVFNEDGTRRPKYEIARRVSQEIRDSVTKQVLAMNTVATKGAPESFAAALQNRLQLGRQSVGFARHQLSVTDYEKDIAAKSAVVDAKTAELVQAQARYQSNYEELLKQRGDTEPAVSEIKKPVLDIQSELFIATAERDLLESEHNELKRIVNESGWMEEFNEDIVDDEGRVTYVGITKDEYNRALYAGIEEAVDTKNKTTVIEEIEREYSQRARWSQLQQSGAVLRRKGRTEAGVPYQVKTTGEEEVVLERLHVKPSDVKIQTTVTYDDFENVIANNIEDLNFMVSDLFNPMPDTYVAPDMDIDKKELFNANNYRMAVVYDPSQLPENNIDYDWEIANAKTEDAKARWEYQRDMSQKRKELFGTVQGPVTSYLDYNMAKESFLDSGYGAGISQDLIDVIQTHFSSFDKRDWNVAYVGAATALQNAAQKGIVFDLTDEGMNRWYEEFSDLPGKITEGIKPDFSDYSMGKRLLMQIHKEVVREGYDSFKSGDATKDNPVARAVRDIFNQAVMLDELKPNATGDMFYDFLHAKDGNRLILDAVASESVYKDVAKLDGTQLGDILAQEYASRHTSSLEQSMAIHQTKLEDAEETDGSGRKDQYLGMEEELEQQRSGLDIDERDGLQSPDELERTSQSINNLAAEERHQPITVSAYGRESDLDEKQVRKMYDMVFGSHDEKTTHHLAIAESIATLSGRENKYLVQIPNSTTFGEGHLRFRDESLTELYVPSMKQRLQVVNTDNSSADLIHLDIETSFPSVYRSAPVNNVTYTKAEAPYRSGFAVQGALKRSGIAEIVSDPMTTLGALKEFTEGKRTAVTFDVESTITNPKHLDPMLELPIEIYARELEWDKESNQLVRNENGRFAVKGSDGNTVQERHYITGLPKYARDAAESFMDAEGDMGSDARSYDASRFVIDVGSGENARQFHVTDYIAAGGSNDGKAFIETLSKYTNQKGVNDALGQLGRMEEEWRYLNYIAKYAFTLDKTPEQIERFEQFSKAMPVSTVEEIANRRDSVDFIEDDFVREHLDLDDEFNEKRIGIQMAETEDLFRHVDQAMTNLQDPSFQFGGNSQRVDVETAVQAVSEMTKNKIVYGKNIESADVGLLVRTANSMEDGYDASLKNVYNNLLNHRKETFFSAVDEYAPSLRTQVYLNPKDADLVDAGKLDPKGKTPVRNFGEALSYLESKSNIRLSLNDAITEIDAQIEKYTGTFNSLQDRVQLTPEQFEIAMSNGLSEVDPFTLSHIVSVAGKTDFAAEIENNMRSTTVMEDQYLSRLLNPELKSHTTDAIMEIARKEAAESKTPISIDGVILADQTAHIAQVDVGLSVERTLEPAASAFSAIRAGEPPKGSGFLKSAVDGIDFEKTAPGDMFFMEEAFDNAKRGVYRLEEFNNDFTKATFTRMNYDFSDLTVGELEHQGIDIPSLTGEQVTLHATTAPRLNTAMNQHFRFLPDSTSINEAFGSYVDDNSRAFLSKTLGSMTPFNLQRMNAEILQTWQLGGMREAGDITINESGAIDMSSYTPLSNVRRRADELYQASQDGNLDAVAEGDIADAVALNENNLKRLDGDELDKYHSGIVSPERERNLNAFNQFLDTKLGQEYKGLMNDVGAMVDTGVISKDSASGIISAWNQQIKEKAEQAGAMSTRPGVFDLPDYTSSMEVMVGNEVQNVQMPISGTGINLSDTVRATNSIEQAIKNAGTVHKYDSAEFSGNYGAYKQHVLNNVVMPEIYRASGLTPQFFTDRGSVGPLTPQEVASGLVSASKEENFAMQPKQYADHIELANLVENDTKALQEIRDVRESLISDRTSKLSPAQLGQLSHHTRVKEELFAQGMYVPTLTVPSGSFDYSELHHFEDRIVRDVMDAVPISDFVAQADAMATSTEAIDKEKTNIIYRHLANVASSFEDGRSIDPQRIIESGSPRQLEAAAAMNWIMPTTGIPRANDDYMPMPTGQRRMGFGQYAGWKMSDLPVGTIANYVQRGMGTIDNDGVYGQQMKDMASYYEEGLPEHSGRTKRAPTARGELKSANEEIKAAAAEADITRPGDMLDDAIQATESYTDNNPHMGSNGKPLFGREVRESDLVRIPEMIEPTAERTSPLGEAIGRRAADLKMDVGNLIESTGGGGRWMVGLGVAAAALAAFNNIDAPLRLEERPQGHGVRGGNGQPEDDMNRENRQQKDLKVPNVDTSSNTYVTSGEKGYTIKARGTAPAGIETDQLTKSVNDSMSGAQSVNINLQDDRSSFDTNWLEEQFTNFFSRGHVDQQ